MTESEYRLLRWAVARASEWRGELIGRGEEADAALAQFDARIKQCYDVLKRVRHATAPLDRATRDDAARPTLVHDVGCLFIASASLNGNIRDGEVAGAALMLSVLTGEPPDTTINKIDQYKRQPGTKRFVR